MAPCRAQIKLFLAVALVASASPAIKVTSEFTGVWTAAEASDDRCRRGDWKGDSVSASDRLISVLASRREEWEAACDVKSVTIPNARSSDDKSVQVTLACGGEGRRWSTVEIWHVQTVEQKRSWP